MTDSAATKTRKPRRKTRRAKPRVRYTAPLAVDLAAADFTAMARNWPKATSKAIQRQRLEEAKAEAEMLAAAFGSLLDRL